MYIDEYNIGALAFPYKDGKKQKKLECVAHVQSEDGITIKNLIPLIEAFQEAHGQFNHRVKVIIEFEEQSE